MFETSMLESAHLIRTQSRWPAVISFAIQATIVAVVISIPVLHPELVKPSNKLTELTAPVIPKPIPIVVQRVHMENVSSTNSLPATNVAPATHTAVISHTYAQNTHSTDPEFSGVMTTMPSGASTSGAPAPFSSTGSPNVVEARPVAPARARISTGVSAGLLLSPIQPIYPAIAKAAHIEGMVLIHAIISKEGHIESATVTGGPMMLAQAALDAVRTARYRPYLLNGVPTEVDTTFQVNFKLQ